jgi:HEAT repeat protein
MATLAVHGDPAVSAAAISALGKIGGKSAARCLRRLKPMESLKPAYMTALLDCARSLKGSDAVSLYTLVLADKTSQRIGALSGMLAADEKKAISLMADFIKGDDVRMSSGALTLVCGQKSERLTKAMAELLGTLPDEKKPALMAALGARGDPAALGSIAACMASTNEVVRSAAVKAASKIGDDGMVKILLGMNGGATEAIARMPGSGVNDALMKALEDNSLKVSAIRAIVARNCVAAVPSLFKLLNDGDPEVRKASWNGLGSLATEDDIDQKARIAFALKDEGELACGVAAVRKVCAYARDKAKRFDVIAGYYDGTTDDAKLTIVDLASLVGSPSAMDIVNKAMNSANKELRSSAVRSLAAWCNESAAGALLELAKNAPEEGDRLQTLRGYIRIAGDGPNLNPDQRGEMLKKAAELATRADEKKLVIGALGAAHNAVTLTIVNRYMDDPALRDEAEQYAATILEHICIDHRDKDFPADEVKDLANKLLTSKNQGFVDRAKKTLADVGK